jgi:superfamily II DNA or RNA helicase
MRTNLTSLERLEAQIRVLQEGTPQGAAWEAALVRWVNAGGHPDLVKGWGWKQWPGRTKAGLPRIERGVDLIAEDRAGRLVAIQAKFRNDPDSPVKTGEVQKFVGAYRKHFPRRMLISNASSRARGIKEAVGDAEAELVLRTDLAESLFDWVASKPLPRPKVTPLPFQKEAAAAIKKHLKDGGRAQIVMACGSGKTYTTLLAMEALGSERVLVLAPTLLLVKQLRDEWMRERTNAWATLAVCSDIGTDEGDDSTQLSPGEIGSKPTTDPAEIAIFLKSKGPYVVFGTYASSARIATAQKKAGVPAFDLVVADEAHRIAGAVGKADKDERAQRVVLDEKGIRAERRLFATATPRVYGGDKKKDGEEVVLESMDDPTRFGEEVYKLTFQQAVDLERLVPYKLLVTIVTDEEIAALIHDRKYVDLQGKPIPADDLATAIAVRRAYKELGISRVISYHGNIKRARAFAQLVQEVKTSGKAPEAECVTGAMPVEDRKEALTRLANAEGPYLITNARCLTEGIDVPALDAVAFADPRRSQVDIVQAVGRAMRKPRGTSSKTTGYIILPVFLSKKELNDPETAVEGSAFAPVLQVLRALKAHDPYRATFFAKILVEEGKRPHKKGEGIDEILQVSIGKELDRALTKRLEQAVQLRAVEVAIDRFPFWLALLRQFVNREGHCLVPGSHHEDGHALGRWVSKRRQKRDTLNTMQISELDQLGFVWDARGVMWPDGFNALQVFAKREGHARVPSKWVEQGYRLGQWVASQRNHFREGSLPQQRVNLLETIPGWTWAPRDARWDEQFSFAKALVDELGTSLLGRSAVDRRGNRVGQWLHSQRSSKGEGTDSRRRLLLEALPHWTWNTRDQHHVDRIDELKQLQLLTGNWKASYSENPGLNQYLRRYHDNPERYPNWVAEALSSLPGFTSQEDIDPFQDTVSELYEFLAKNTRMPIRTKGKENAETQENRLARFVSWNRWLMAKGRLASDRASQLEALPGWSWNAREDQWETGLVRLIQFAKEFGTCLVPQTFVCNDGFQLGAWVGTKRAQFKRGRIPEDRVKILESLPGWDWKPSRGRAGRNSLPPRLRR